MTDYGVTHGRAVGIGMAVIVAAEDAEKAQKALKAAGETVYRIGVIEALPAGEALCVVR